MTYWFGIALLFITLVGVTGGMILYEQIRARWYKIPKLEKVE